MNGKLARISVTALLMLVVLVPIYWMAAASLKSNKEITVTLQTVIPVRRDAETDRSAPRSRPRRYAGSGGVTMARLGHG